MTTSEHGTTTFLPLPIDLLSAFFEEMSSIPPKLSAPQNSYRLVRIFALVVAIPLSIFTFWLLLINELRVGFNIFGSGFDLSFAVAAFICWWFALRGEYEKSRVSLSRRQWQPPCGQHERSADPRSPRARRRRCGFPSRLPAARHEESARRLHLLFRRQPLPGFVPGRSRHHLQPQPAVRRRHRRTRSDHRGARRQRPL